LQLPYCPARLARMGVGGSRTAESLDTGTDVPSAAVILARRLAKAKQSLDKGQLERAREKALSALHLCTKWCSPPSKLEDKVLLDALHKAVWLLAHLSAGRARDPSQGVVLRAMVVMAEVAARACGAESWQLADVWFALAQHASDMGNWPVAVNFGHKAAELLRRVRADGDTHFVPNSAIQEIPWDAFDKPEFSTAGYIDALPILAHAHCQLRERREAQKAAAQHLQLLERKFGRGAPDTIPGLNSMMAAACMMGEGDMKTAIAWARHIVELRVRANKGSPYAPEVAEAYEAVALMFLCPGQYFSPDMAQRIGERAGQLRAGCLANPEPAAAVLASVESVRRARAEGRKNTRGVSLGGGSPSSGGEEGDDLDRAADEALEAGGYGAVIAEASLNAKLNAAAGGGAGAVAAAVAAAAAAAAAGAAGGAAGEGGSGSSSGSSSPSAPLQPIRVPGSPGSEAGDAFEDLTRDYAKVVEGGEAVHEGDGVGMQACSFLTQIASTL
jgi:hypothetical protein